MNAENLATVGDSKPGLILLTEESSTTGAIRNG